MMKNKKRFGPEFWIHFFLVVALCILGFLMGVMMTRSLTPQKNLAETQNTSEPSDSTTQTEPEVETIETVPLTIDWIPVSEQPEIEPDAEFVKAVCDQLISQETTCRADTDLITGAINPSYKLGTVKGGISDGFNLLMTTIKIEEIFNGSHDSFYLLYDPSGLEKPVMLKQHFVTVDGYDKTDLFDVIALAANYQVDETSRIPELSFEKSLVDTETNNTFIFTGLTERLKPQDLTIKPAIIFSNSIPLFAWEDGSLSLVQEDGRHVEYDLLVPFLDGMNEGVPQVKWNDGSTNTQTYYKGDVGGCGLKNFTNVVDQTVIDTLELKQTGMGIGLKDQKEYLVFEPTIFENDYFDNKSDRIRYEEDEKTYTNFVRPFFYFEDFLGRWIEFQSIEIVPPGECGKPVIYLYPEKPTDLTVWIDPKGGFTYTEPDYGTGWHVRAYPNGTIVNKTDGREYPYLFWEGRGRLYVEPERYWVVRENEVEVFLRQTLEQMGLIDQEIADFLEFWLPRMQSAPYYKIGFHGTPMMDQLAPLSFSETPDSVFRILMDYEPLENAMPSNPPTHLPRANREGFYVIEWGGVLR